LNGEGSIVGKYTSIVPSIKFFIFGIIELILLLVMFIVITNTNWSGPSGCLSEDGTYDICYCEAFSGGKIKEPINTFSALAFSLGGVMMLFYLDVSPLPNPINRMTSDVSYASCYGYLAVFLGPGSMLFHGTLSALGGFMDTLSMYLWLSFIVVYNIIRMFGISKIPAAIVYTALVTTLAVVQNYRGGDSVFATLVFIAVFTEIAVFVRCKFQFNWNIYRWLIGGIVVFLISLTIWKLSRTGGILCYPHAWIQGHAVWHSLCAVTVAMLYRYYQVALDPPVVQCHKNV